jgi:hypothetical protein
VKNECKVPDIHSFIISTSTELHDRKFVSRTSSLSCNHPKFRKKFTGFVKLLQKESREVRMFTRHAVLHPATTSSAAKRSLSHCRG